MRLFSDVASWVTNPFLRRAFQLAEGGRGTTSPNPVVGCVIARGDEIVGEGFHARAGLPHAETLALAEAGPRAAGATAYVTLEPCNHVGRTPPCSEELIAAGLAAVVVGMADPNPIAAGGALRLRQAGMRVEFAPDPTPFQIQNEGWLHLIRTGRPFTRVKVALSLDGHASVRPGARCAITGQGGAEITHRLRSAADAVLVGAATARIDAPALTARTADGGVMGRQPLRVVLGRSGVPEAELFHDGHGQSVALVPVGVEVPEGVAALRYPAREGIGAALRALGRAGVADLLVEAGPRLFTALWSARLIDELVVTHGGGLAGPEAPPLWRDALQAPPGALGGEMTALEAGVASEDAVTVWRPRRAADHQAARPERGRERGR